MTALQCLAGWGQFSQARHHHGSYHIALWSLLTLISSLDKRDKNPTGFFLST